MGYLWEARALKKEESLFNDHAELRGEGEQLINNTRAVVKACPWTRQRAGKNKRGTSPPSTSLACSSENLLFMASANDISQFSTRWSIDCGATDHMSPKSSRFSKYNPNHGQKKVFTAGVGGACAFLGIRTVEVHPLGLLKNVLHVPQLKAHLIYP